MKIQPISNNTNFNGNISQKAGQFLKAQSMHICQQGLNWVILSKLYPIENVDQFWRRKIVIDLAECFSNYVCGHEITGAKQITNIFSNAADCAKDVIRWIGKIRKN